MGREAHAPFFNRSLMLIQSYILYKHTSPSGKVYIGITSRAIARRWGVSGCGYRAQPYFWNAIQKYGWNNFKHEILLYGLSRQEASDREKEFIAKYHSNDPNYGYNLTTGGETGYNFSPVIVAKQSEGLKRKWRDPEYRKKVSEAKTGTHWAMSEESKARMRKPKSEETKAKMRKPKSEETRRKMSEAKKIYFANMTPEQKREFGEKCKRKAI